MIAFDERRDQLRRERLPIRIDNPAEFDRLAHHLRQSAINCGADHARCVAEGFSADFRWEAEELLRAASVADQDAAQP
ncbi:hypothetical protein [Sphingomonas panacis]|uniref:hypothetical protein n=1 Tax=Sphingomonas panacis TaxID=1560345 RepID=UPI0012375E44|nr:hypothetical protein [Sphingomonas panacis]